VTASLQALWSKLGKLEDNGVILTGATGAEPATSEELAFLRQHGDFAIRATGTAFGHNMEAQFILGLALAALSISRGALFPANDPTALELEMAKPPTQIVVTGAGHWRSEGMALVETVK
jgi:3-oxoacyl-[acyl-carrier-protein] synthase II